MGLNKQSAPEYLHNLSNNMTVEEYIKTTLSHLEAEYDLHRSNLGVNDTEIKISYNSDNILYYEREYKLDAASDISKHASIRVKPFIEAIPSKNLKSSIITTYLTNTFTSKVLIDREL